LYKPLKSPAYSFSMMEKRKPSCEEVIAQGPPCDGTFVDVSRYRMCRAWDLIKRGEEKELGVAMKRASEEYKATCKKSQ